MIKTFIAWLLDVLPRSHFIFWLIASIWISFVAVFWYWLFSGSLTFISVPEGESGYTFGYFIGALGVGVVAIVLAGRRTHTLMEQVQNDRSKVEQDRAKMINENFTKSVELLGHDKVAVRQGGVFALQRLLREQDLYSTVIRIIASFVRDQSQIFQKVRASSDSTLPVDVEAALIVVRDRKSTGPHDYESRKIREIQRQGGSIFDLSNSFLLNADLTKIDFRFFNLSDCVIEGCLLKDADLSGANLSSTTFRDAELDGANFDGAQIDGAEFIGSSNLKLVHGLMQTQIDVANGRSEIELPEGLIRPARWS